MKLKLKSNLIPVLGWCDISDCQCYEQLVEEMSNGDSIIYNTDIDLDEDELCAFIFYADYSKKTVYAIFSGTAEYLGRHIDHSAPLTYVFYPGKKIKPRVVGYDKDSRHPKVVILKAKKVA